MTLSNEYQSMAANAICHAASMAAEEWRAAGAMHGAPSVVWKPRLFIDGDQWCALYGDNLQDGVAGFGDSPSAAMWDFDKAWGAKLKTPNVQGNRTCAASCASSGSPQGCASKGTE